MRARVPREGLRDVCREIEREGEHYIESLILEDSGVM
jgi:hypothetical protein